MSIVWVSSALRYGLTGLAMSVAIYLAYLAITWAHLSPLWGLTVVYPGAVLASYFINRRFAFGSTRPHRSASWRFLVTHSVGYLMNLGLLWLFTKFTDFDHRIVEAVVLVCVGLFLFVVLRTFVFPVSATTKAGSQ